MTNIWDAKEKYAIYQGLKDEADSKKPGLLTIHSTNKEEVRVEYDVVYRPGRITLQVGNQAGRLSVPLESIAPLIQALQLISQPNVGIPDNLRVVEETDVDNEANREE